MRHSGVASHGQNQNQDPSSCQPHLWPRHSYPRCAFFLFFLPPLCLPVSLRHMHVQVRAPERVRRTEGKKKKASGSDEVKEAKEDDVVRRTVQPLHELYVRAAATRRSHPPFISLGLSAPFANRFWSPISHFPFPISFLSHSLTQYDIRTILPSLDLHN
jgi:hypothetical protein